MTFLNTETHCILKWNLSQELKMSTNGLYVTKHLKISVDMVM